MVSQSQTRLLPGSRIYAVLRKTENVHNRPFLHSTPERTSKRTRTELGLGNISCVSCIFVHPDLDSAPLFVGVRERSITCVMYQKIELKLAVIFIL